MTILQYLQHPDLLKASSVITSSGNDVRGVYLILESSLFYPQGGGQPADQGKICVGKDVYNVFDVRNVDGEVRHYIDKDYFNRTQNRSVEIHVDEYRRDINTRYHSAGHLIAAIAENLSSEIVAMKGHQFPGEAYVEFSGVLADAENFMMQMKKVLNDKLNSNSPVVIKNLDAEQAEIIEKGLLYKVPKNENLRVCCIEGFTPTPCGGTHVKNLREIGPINIIKCKSKKGKTKIFYNLSKDKQTNTIN
ncbi:MAG: hypothetical protein K0T99_04420 [Alphaproteobacteria bacterium]|nr:hypothetical protein [Alphaproteobacteria bacterium]